MEYHDVTGGGGVRLRVADAGRGGRPILFVHGYTQSHLAWVRQLRSELADDYRLVALDNRGHGASEKPGDGYADPSLWADDLTGVIEELDLADPVLVGWSYGGLILSDYLATRGTDRIAGLVFAGAISKLGTEDALAVIGEDFLDLVDGFESTDAETSWYPEVGHSPFFEAPERFNRELRSFVEGL